MKKQICLICVILLLFAGCDWFNDDDDDGINLQEHEVTDTYIWPAEDYDQLTAQSVNGLVQAGAVFGTEIIVWYYGLLR